MKQHDEMATPRFRATRGLRRGYEATEVETFIEAVVDALRSPMPSLRAVDVAWQRFRCARLKAGYDMDDVDAYLSEVEHLLGERESRRLWETAA